MNHSRFCIASLLLAVVMMLTATGSLNAASATSVAEPGRSIGGLTAILPAAARKRSFCQTQFDKCAARCKRGDASGVDACMSICTSDEWWCSAFCPFGPNPC